VEAPFDETEAKEAVKIDVHGLCTPPRNYLILLFNLPNPSWGRRRSGGIG
jgi:hypothetical protein